MIITMRGHSILLLFAFIALIINTASCSRDPKEWRLVQAARAEQIVSFHVALHQQNTHELEKHLYDISDPTSPRYGQELSSEQIMEIIAPPKSDHDAVFNWFTAQGNVQIHSYGDALKVSAPVHLVEKVLRTRLFTFEHIRKTNYRVIRQVGGFTIPTEISDKIYMITGLTTFPFVRPGKDPKPVEYDSEKRQTVNFPYVSISNIRSLYNIPVGTAATSKNTIQVAMEFLPVGAPFMNDIQDFCTMSNEYYANFTQIFGPYLPGQLYGESMLDVELLMGLGTKVTNWYYTIAEGWIYEMALELFNLPQAPGVVSVSFGWPEIDSCDSDVDSADCTGMSVAQWINRTNIELMKVGLRRTSVIVATQDSGAPGPLNANCANTTHPVFAIYPASSPYITSISATSLIPSRPADGQEKRHVAQNNNLPICQSKFKCVNGPVTEFPASVNNTGEQWTTGGGFSELSDMPPYQASVVQKYLSTPGVFVPPSKFFNPTKRGYPDFSAVGARILLVTGGAVHWSEGTSASTPIVSAMISLLNDARVQSGKSTLGFLNPMLYKMYADNPNTFTDVTSGDNRCARGSTCCQYGYGATPGWDAVTGLGTPNYSEINQYVQNLP